MPKVLMISKIKSSCNVLWEGSWNSGAITVNNLRKYTVLAIEITSGNNAMLAYKSHTGRLNFIGGALLSSSNNQYIDMVTLLCEGDTLTMINKSEMGHYPSSNHGQAVMINITRIIGIL